MAEAFSTPLLTPESDPYEVLGGVEVVEEIQANALRELVAEVLQEASSTKLIEAESGAADEDTEAANLSPELAHRRILADVFHVMDAIRDDGSIPKEVLDDVLINKQTEVCEMGIPAAVTETFQRARYTQDEMGLWRREFTWLGKNIVELAENGKLFYSSPLAQPRNNMEIRGAAHTQATLRPGFAQAEVSPQATAFDMPLRIAEAENIAGYDSIRASFAVTNTAGETIGRRLSSLLVKDVPLEAWVEMFEDPGNIFGRAFDITEKRSAVSVMELFSELEIPEHELPEGSVTLVAAVLRYIKDPELHASVTEQLAEFRTDQERYRRQAEQTGLQRRDYTAELAKSLNQKYATADVCDFIENLNREWSDTMAAILAQHARPDGGYHMTIPLAAALEKANQNILTSIAAIATDNQEVLQQISQQDATALRSQIAHVEAMRAQGATPAELKNAEGTLHKNVASKNLEIKGGCPDPNSDNFKDDDSPNSDKSTSSKEGSGEKKAMTCPFCGAKVWGDPCAKVLSCWDCKAYAKNGRIVYKGDGGSKKRTERAAVREAARAAKKEEILTKMKATRENEDRRREAAAAVNAAFQEMRQESAKNSLRSAPKSDRFVLAA